MLIISGDATKKKMRGGGLLKWSPEPDMKWSLEFLGLLSWLH